MEMTLGTRLRNGWNAFFNKDPTPPPGDGIGTYYGGRPDRTRLHYGNERSIATAVYNRMAVDVSAIKIRHVRLDENERYKNDIDSGLNSCLKLSANRDQTGRAFIQDIAMTMFDSGVVAVIINEANHDPTISESFDIRSMRVGTITEWRPQHVKVRAFNENTGHYEEGWFPKSCTAIIENPFYSVMNEPNSTLKRLIRKLALLDVTDENNNSGKLDLIIQLPYSIRSEGRRELAEKRRKDIEMQLAGSKYGIAYADGTERIVQLNRQIENQLMSQVESLTSMLYSQLGITEDIMNGQADEKVMTNYNNHTIEPILSAICDEFTRKFLSKTARSQGQSVEFFIDPFRLVPVANIAEIADKLTRNEIMTSNEVRSVLGMKPSENPEADELRNKNMPNNQAAQPETQEMEEPSEIPTEENQNGSLQE